MVFLFSVLDALFPMGCRATEDSSEADAPPVLDSLSVRGRKHHAAFVLILTKMLNAKIFVGQSKPDPPSPDLKYIQPDHYLFVRL